MDSYQDDVRTAEGLRRHRAGTVAMLAAASVSLLAFQSVAVAADTAASNEALEEVVITGSSIAQRADTSPLPVTTLTSKDIAKTGLTSASDLIQKLPAMQGFVGASNSVNGAGAGQTTAALHSLPSKYTVVLLDGQRIAGYSLNNGLGGGSAVNLESIPLEAIERVEVLTDGASALYGADAVAGVVNFVTKKNNTDGNAFYHASVPDQHGGGDWSAGFTKGFGDLKSDGYNILLTYQHDVQNVLNASDRDVSRRGGFFKFNSGGTTYVFNTRTSNTEPGNIILPSSLGSFNPYYSGTYTGPGGTLAGGTGNCGNTHADVLIGGPTDITCRFNYAATVEDIAPFVRDSGLLRGTFQVGDDSQVWAEAIVSQFDLTARYAAPAQPLGLSPTRLSALWTGYVVPYLNANHISYVGGTQDNPGCTSPSADVVGPNPCMMDAKATLGYRAVSAGGRTDDWGYATRHIAAGFDTKFGGWDFHLTAVASHGQFTDTAAGGYLDFDQFSTAVASGAYDPVLGSGQSALKATILHDPFSTTYTDLNTIGVNAQHKVMDLTGGPSILSIGAEYVTSRNKIDYSDLLQAGNGTVDQPNTTDAVVGGGGGAVNFEGDRKNEGVFAEWLLPFMDNLNVIASARYDTYDKVHSTTIYNTAVPNAQGLYDRLPSGSVGNSFSNATYKVSARWTPIEMLAFRASIGTGFKVPEITDIAGTLAFNGSTAGSYACPIPGAPGCLPGNAQYDLLAGPNSASGANGLKPEKSTQYTFGVRVDPVKGLFFSADYWNVHVKDQIQSAGISEQLAYGNPSQYGYLFVSPYTDPVGQFTTIALMQVPFNGGAANYSGIDFNFGYSNDTAWGTFNANLGGTYMLTQNYTYSDGGAKNTDLGIFGPDNTVVFKTVLQASVGLTTGKWANTLSAHYKSGYTDIAHVGDGAVFADDPSSPTAFGAKVDFCCLSVPAYYTFDWQTSYDIAKAVNLTVGIKNLADKDPPLSLQNAGGGNQAGYDGRYADPLGRTYYFRANYKF